MNIMKKVAAGIAAGLIALGVGIPAAQAACYYYAPTSGYDGHVHYYNCRGPYVYNAYTSNRAWECYADWDWYAEVFWGKHDGSMIVYSGPSCYA